MCTWKKGAKARVEFAFNFAMDRQSYGLSDVYKLVRAAIDRPCDDTIDLLPHELQCIFEDALEGYKAKTFTNTRFTVKGRFR